MNAGDNRKSRASIINDFKIEIKAEAVKWVKANNVGSGPLTVYEWIKHFFNITEEDLA